jgi:hypothetical protein
MEFSAIASHRIKSGVGLREAIQRLMREAGNCFGAGATHCRPCESSVSEHTEITADVGYRTARKAPLNGHKLQAEMIP